MRNNQAGTAPLVIILGVIILLVIGFAAWRIFNADQAAAPANPMNGAESIEHAPPVESAEDLDQAEAFLNQADIDAELDTSEIEEALGEE